MSYVGHVSDVVHGHGLTLSKIVNPYVNNVRHMTYICHLQTLNHTYKYNLAPHAGFPIIPALRQSFTSETLDRGARRSNLIAFSVRGWTNGFFIYICLFSTYVHGKPRLNTFHHIIHTGRHVSGVSTYGSTILQSVSPYP